MLLKQAAGKLSRPMKTSSNSSLPSSKNPIGIKHTRSLREKSGKKIGGQVGHKGKTRLQTTSPDEIELCQTPIICPVCGKSLTACEQTMGERRQLIDLPSIIVPYEILRREVQKSDVIGCDETGITVNAQNNWLWTFQTDMATYLVMDESRSKSVIAKHFPTGFPEAILVTDRLAAYFSLEVKDHQVCLAHLLRNTAFFVEYLPQKKWPKEMMQLFKNSIHERKTNGVSAHKDKKFKTRFDKLIDATIEFVYMN